MDAEPARGGDAAAGGGGPGERFAALLARAENGERAALLAAEVRSALMHHCGLQSCRHAKGPPRPMNRRTYRHSFLLPDGGVRLLWELEHDTGPGGGTVYALFTDREDLAVAEWDVDTAFGFAAGPPELPPGLGALGRGVEAPEGPGGEWPPGSWPSDAPGPRGAGGRAGFRRAYTESDSADHAWRLLRRAANAGATGDEMRDRLRTAIAHGITIVTRRSTVVAGRPVSWSLYEHAFLLLDGSEVSLWEIDHTRTPSGDPVCEVYTSQDAALDTGVRRIVAG
jgi:hypothetical protein